MEELTNLNLIDQAISLVSPRNSGKSHLLSHLLYNTIKRTSEQDNQVINILIYCQSFVDSNTYFHLCILTILDELQCEPIDLDDVTIFKLKDHIEPACIHDLTKNSSHYIIFSIIIAFVKHLTKNNKCKKRTDKKFKTTRFFFNGSISPSTIKTIIDKPVKSNKNRKLIVIVDDVRAELYKEIRKDIVYIYEQGRHHDIAVVIIDQYIKSTKVPPEIRLTSSHLMFRAFDENIRKEICNICAFDKNKLDIDNIRNLINEYYAIIIDFNDKTKLFYIRAPKLLFRD